MPRRARMYLPGLPYHVVLCGRANPRSSAADLAALSFSIDR